jgi:prevent-host-death family protein
MKTMQIGELKTHFSQVLERIKKGEKIVISYGKKKENIAVIIPYSEYNKSHSIKIGGLKGKAKYSFGKDFEMSSEEITGS